MTWKPTDEMVNVASEKANENCFEIYDYPDIKAALIAVQPLIAAEAIEKAAKLLEGHGDLYQAELVRSLIPKPPEGT